uniref:Uncharacterized protein n=1 Tax=Anopheles quadriannulatus TaxID=34691 RepID=A0A182X591_ANOQN
MFNTNLCLDYAKRLADQMTSFFEEVYQESNQRRELFLADISELRQQRLLGEQQQGLPAGKLSEEPQTLSKQFRSYLDHLKAKKMQRLEYIGNLRRETKKLISCLETTSITKEQQRLLNARKFPPTRVNMHRLRMLHEEMSAEYESLKQHID